MKKTILLLLISVYSVHTIAAMVHVAGKKYIHRSCSTYLYSSQRKVLAPVLKETKKAEPLIAPTFCAILEQNIFTIPTLCYTYYSQNSQGTLPDQILKRSRDAAFLVNSLAQTNKFLNTFINDTERTLDLIKKLSHHFYSDDLQIACRLCTKSSKERFLLQKAFFDGCVRSPLFHSYHANLLKEKGLEVNFSYYLFNLFPLVEVLNKGNTTIAKWLIENGADITVCSTRAPIKTTAYMCVLACYDTDLMHKVLGFPEFDVHWRNADNDTPLHYCFFIHQDLYGFKHASKKNLADGMYEVIAELLKKGADPMAVNNQGFTPFDWAKESGDENLVALMEYYIKNPTNERDVSDFDSQKNADSVC